MAMKRMDSVLFVCGFHSLWPTPFYLFLMHRELFIVSKPEFFRGRDGNDRDLSEYGAKSGKREKSIK